MFTDSQRAQIRLRMAREKAEALVEELTRAQQQADDLIRLTGADADDLRVDIGRQAMGDAIAKARHSLRNINNLLTRVESGEIDPVEIDFDMLDQADPDEKTDTGPPCDTGQGPQIP